MVKSLEEHFGGTSKVCADIAAGIRSKQPNHPLATASDPQEVMKHMTVEEIVDLIYLCELSIFELMQHDMTRQELQKWSQASENNSLVADAVTLGEVRQQLYVADAIEQGSSGFGEMTI